VRLPDHNGEDNNGRDEAEHEQYDDRVTDVLPRRRRCERIQLQLLNLFTHFLTARTALLLQICVLQLQLLFLAARSTAAPFALRRTARGGA